MAGKISLKQLNKLIFADRLQVSDAVVWLQGDCLDRGPKVLELFKEAWAGKIIISGNNKLLGAARPGEKNIDLGFMKSWLIKREVKPTSLIIDDKAFNTRNQAINVISLAKAKGWRSLIIVGSWPYYQFRVFLTFLKAAEELDWHGRIINQFAIIPYNQKPGGRDKTCAQLLVIEAAKLPKYRRHVVSVKQGIGYLNAKNPKFNFRKATLKDGKFLWQLRNDPEVRKNSFSRDRIKFADHVAWLKRSLSNKNRFLFILSDKSKQSIGQMRFDKEGSAAEISIALHKRARHKGYGVPVIQLGSDYFLAQNGKKVKTLVAKIKPENKSSIQAFLRAGYKPFASNVTYVTLAYKLIPIL